MQIPGNQLIIYRSLLFVGTIDARDYPIRSRVVSALLNPPTGARRSYCHSSLILLLPVFPHSGRDRLRVPTRSTRSTRSRHFQLVGQDPYE